MGVYTPTRHLYKPADGETGWGDLVDANWDNLDATANTSYVDTGDANTLASAEAYTNSAVAGITSPVTSVAGKTGAVVLVEGDITGLTADLAAKAPLASPALTGTPTAPTATATDNTTKIATTAFVQAAVAGITVPVTSVAGKTGAVLLVEGDIANLTTDLAAKAPLASPALTGTPTAPTPTTGDNSTNIATTAYVMAAYPKVVAKVVQKAETGADATLLSYTPPAVAGSYRLSFILSVTATTGANVGWTATWTDPNGNAQAPTNLNIFTAGTAGAALSVAAAAAKVCYAEFVIDTNNSGTAIVIKATATAAATYIASATIERLA